MLSLLNVPSYDKPAVVAIHYALNICTGECISHANIAGLYENCCPNNPGVRVLSAQPSYGSRSGHRLPVSVERRIKT